MPLEVSSSFACIRCDFTGESAPLVVTLARRSTGARRVIRIVSPCWKKINLGKTPMGTTKDRLYTRPKPSGVAS